MRGVVLSFLLITSSTSAWAEESSFTFSDPECLPQGRPAATLLVPYFEIDLEDVNGRSTLFSVNNADEEPVTARVVLWTECGIPVLSFDRWLEPGDVLPINLRDVVANGTLPASGFACLSGAALRDSADEANGRNLAEAPRAALEARLSGRPDPDDGLCYGLDRSDEPRIARGYVTIDVVDEPCSLVARYPIDEGYFASDGSGIAGDRNVLWGDVFQVDPGENFAQGYAAVDVRADRARAEQLGFFRPPFYDDLSSDRLPLGAEFRSRYFVGGAFDGGTEMILWRGQTQSQGMTCGETCSGSTFAEVRVFEESGRELDTQFAPGNTQVEKIRVGTDLQAAAAGWLSLRVLSPPNISPPLPSTSAWLQTTFSARGRFSVGLDTTITESACNQIVQEP